MNKGSMWNYAPYEVHYCMSETRDIQYTLNCDQTALMAWYTMYLDTIANVSAIF